MNKFFSALENEIEKHELILLFRHIHPDGDALGSQHGLEQWLQARYPEKTVLCLGEGEAPVQLSDEQLQSALAIITDTSNSPRIDDDRWQKARTIARIDHHVQVEDFGPLDYVDDKSSATCQIIAQMLQENGETIPAAGAQRLLEGLMTDTMKFTISSVTPDTYRAAAWLMEQGADPLAANRKMFSRTEQDVRYTSLLVEKATRQGAFMFTLASQDDYLSRGFRFEDAKNFVSAIANIEGIEVWALFTQHPDGNYSASLRSHTISVREIAAAFGGGGHVCACGIKNLNADQLSDLIAQLSDHTNAIVNQK